MKLTEKQYELTRDILGKNDVALAYIFGSFARGSAGLLSDLDIAVVFRESVPKSEYFNKELSLAGDISEVIEREVDVVNLETNESPVLKHRAVFQGECILNEDPARKFAIELAIMHEYEDTKMLRRLQRQIRHRHIRQGTFGKPAVSIHSRQK